MEFVMMNKDSKELQKKWPLMDEAISCSLFYFT